MKKKSFAVRAFGIAALLCAVLFGTQIVEAPVAAQDSGSLVVYSGRSEELVDPIIQQFAAATGISVSVRYGGTSELLATLLEEGDFTPADVFFAQDPGALGAVESMFSPLPESLTNLVPEFARSNENLWVGLSGRARTVVYNTDELTDSDLPDDIFDFIDPEWNGRIGWAPTNASFQTMVTGMRVLWGEDKTRQWLEGIQANNAVVFPKNTPIVEATGNGEISVGFVNHYYLLRFIAEQGESFAARNYHPRAGGPGGLVMVAGAGVLSASDNQSVAEQFISFMLSEVSQAYFANQTFEYPLVEGVLTNQLLVPLEDINRPDINLSDLDDLQGTQSLLREVGILP